MLLLCGATVRCFVGGGSSAVVGGSHDPTSSTTIEPQQVVGNNGNIMEYLCFLDGFSWWFSMMATNVVFIVVIPSGYS